MVGDIAEKEPACCHEKNPYERTVVDDNFIQTLSSRFVNDDASEKSTPIYGNYEHRAVFLFSAEHDNSCLNYMLDYAFEKAGISKKATFEIWADGGRLVVTSSHPEKDKVERVLNADSNIGETYARLFGSYGRIASFSKYEEFSRAYLENRRDAVEKYREIFDNTNKGSFSILVSENGYEPKFVL